MKHAIAIGILLVALLALLVPTAAGAGDVSYLSLSRLSIGAGVQWSSDQRVGDSAAPLLPARSEWGVAMPFAYNLPSPKEHPLALTYTPTLGFDNHQIRHTFRITYVIKKGGE